MVWGRRCQKAFALESYHYFRIEEALRKLFVAEVLVVTLPNFKYLFLEVVRRSLRLRTILFVALFPVLKLVFPTTVEGVMALAALKECLFFTDLAKFSLCSNERLAHVL